jgi:UDP-glucose 4-epimerase
MKDYWMNWRNTKIDNMKTVIITGATSFIGVHLINHLMAKDNQIIAVVRPNSSKIELLSEKANITLVQADMKDYGVLDQLIGYPCDAVIHLTWNGTRGSDRLDANMQQRDYECAVAALKSSIRLGCKTFISAGSQAEYGSCNCPITEDTPCHPNTEYGEYKLRFFETAKEMCGVSGVHFKEPRFFSLYGSGDFEGTMVISTLKKMLLDKMCDFTESKQMWDFLYIDDAVEGIEKLLESDCADGAYNFGSGFPRELKLFIEEMRKITKSHSILRFGAVPYPKTGMVSIEPVVDKLKRETGWFAKTMFRDGIQNILSDMNV